MVLRQGVLKDDVFYVTTRSRSLRRSDKLQTGFFWISYHQRTQNMLAIVGSLIQPIPQHKSDIHSNLLVIVDPPFAKSSSTKVEAGNRR